jgi:hypothetical protein
MAQCTKAFVKGENFGFGDIKDAPAAAFG